MFENTCLSNLRFMKVVDASGKDIGKIKDAVVNLDDLSIKGFVIHGSKFEEILEDLKIKKDVDPLVKSESIENIQDDVIHLKQSIKELPNAMAEGEIKENESLFSKLRNYPIYNNEGQLLGVFTDIFFDKDKKFSYALGGKEFTKMLWYNSCTRTLNYVVDPENVARIENGFKLKTSLISMERGMKQNLTNIVREIMITANKDGKITDEEAALIESVNVDLPTYMDALETALEDKIITKEEEDHLEHLKENIIANVVNIARQDEKITKDEKLLINKLASYMVDRKKQLFWKVFGTSGK